MDQEQENTSQTKRRPSLGGILKQKTADAPMKNRRKSVQFHTNVQTREFAKGSSISTKATIEAAAAKQQAKEMANKFNDILGEYSDSDDDDQDDAEMSLTMNEPLPSLQTLIDDEDEDDDDSEVDQASLSATVDTNMDLDEYALTDDIKTALQGLNLDDYDDDEEASLKFDFGDSPKGDLTMKLDEGVMKALRSRNSLTLTGVPDDLGDHDFTMQAMKDIRSIMNASDTVELDALSTEPQEEIPTTMSMQEFYEFTGIHFLDKVSHRKTGSLGGLEGNDTMTGEFKSLAFVRSTVIPELELTEGACNQMEASIAQGQATLVEMEKNLEDSMAPFLGQALQLKYSGDPASVSAFQNYVRALKSTARLSARKKWLEWKKSFLKQIEHRLNTNLSTLESEAASVTGALSRLNYIAECIAAARQPNLARQREDLVDIVHMRVELKKVMNTYVDRFHELEKSNAEAEELLEKLEGAAPQSEDRKISEREAKAITDRHALLQRITGIDIERVETFDDGLVQADCGLARGFFAFTLQVFPMSMRFKDARFRVKNDAPHRDVLESFLGQSGFNERLALCTSIAGMLQLLPTMQCVVRRWADFILEVTKVSKSNTLTAQMSDDGDGLTIDVLFTDYALMRQVAVHLSYGWTYPNGVIQDAVVKVIKGQVDVENIHALVKSTSGFRRFEKLANAIQSIVSAK